MNKDYVSYELAKKLKSAGFDEPCDYCYITQYGTSWCIFERGLLPGKWNSEEADSPNDPYQYMSAPTLAHAQKWLREKKRIAINVIAHDTSDWYREGKYHWEEAYLPNFSREGRQWADWFIYGEHPLFDTYEEALSDGLSQMLGLITKGE